MFFKLTFGILNIYKNFDLMKGKLNKICRITSLCFLFPYCISTSVFPVLPAFNKWSIMDINWTIFDWQFTKAMFCSKQHVLARISTEWSDLQALTVSTDRQTHTGVLSFSFYRKRVPIALILMKEIQHISTWFYLVAVSFVTHWEILLKYSLLQREPKVGLCQVVKVLDIDRSQQQPLCHYN